MSQIANIYRYIINNNPPYQILPRLFLALCYQLYKRLIKKPIVKKLFNGKKIWLFPDNPISSAFIYSAFPDQAEILALRKFACPNTIFMDIGANVGAYSILMADRVKAIYAFEAHPETAKYCQMNFKLNGISEQQVITMAVSDNNEPTHFSNGGGGCPLNAIGQPSADTITVPSTTLDEFMLKQQFSKDQRFLLKIDVEGFEYEVFEGAKNFLKNSNVVGMIFETFSNKNNDIVKLLQKLGFSLTQISAHNVLAVREPHVI
jgi:FkbM family methyltransferase